MEFWGTIIAALSAIAGIAAALVAILQAAAARRERKEAEDARNESRSARDEAVRLSKEANEAFKRQAEAQERANEIEIEKLPKPHVRWHVQPGGRNDLRYLGNVGNLDARDVVLTGTGGAQPYKRDSTEVVAPGDSIAFRVAPTYDDVGLPRIQVVWVDETQEPPYAYGTTVQ